MAVRGPRVHNDRAGEVGRALSAADYDLDRIFDREGCQDFAPLRPGGGALFGGLHCLLPGNRAPRAGVGHPGVLRSELPRVLLEGPGSGTAKGLLRDRVAFGRADRQRGGLSTGAGRPRAGGGRRRGQDRRLQGHDRAGARALPGRAGCSRPRCGRCTARTATVGARSCSPGKAGMWSLSGRSRSWTASAAATRSWAGCSTAS